MATKPAVLTRKATVAHGAILATIAPKLATDAKIDLRPALAKITAKNIKESWPGVIAAVQAAVKGKLAQDATIETKDLGKLLDVINVLDPVDAAEDDLSPNGALPAAGLKAKDEEPNGKVREFLKGKLSEDDMKACDDIWGGGQEAMDADETDEEKKAREAKEAAAAKDKGAKDADMDDKVDKKAMDAAIKAAVDATRKTVMTDVRASERALYEARQEVRPYVGELAMGFDSAEQVRRHALEMLGVPEAKSIHESALSTILQMQPKAGARAVERGHEHIAMDAQATTDFNSRFPDAGRIGIS